MVSQHTIGHVYSISILGPDLPQVRPGTCALCRGEGSGQRVQLLTVAPWQNYREGPQKPSPPQCPQPQRRIFLLERGDSLNLGEAKSSGLCMVPQATFQWPKALQTRGKKIQFIPSLRAQERGRKSTGKSSVLHICSRTPTWHKLPSQETFQILSHRRWSQFSSFRMVLSIP